eukprot:6481314-Amphidinium_carterae.3
MRIVTQAWPLDPWRQSPRLLRGSADAGVHVDEEVDVPVLDVEASHDPGNDKFVDEYTREELHKELKDGILKARCAEMDFMRRLGVWTYASTKEAVAKTGPQAISTRRCHSPG